MTATRIFLVFLLILGILFDIGVALLEGPDATISAQMWFLSKEYPILPLAIGILLGHLFWVQSL